MNDIGNQDPDNDGWDRGDFIDKVFKKQEGPVECLGITFESDEKRREHFLGILKEKLKDPEFR